MKRPVLLIALVFMACALSAAEFRMKAAYGANYVSFGLRSSELTSPYPPPAGSAAPRIYFTYGGAADDPDAEAYENLATHMQNDDVAATWTLYAESAATSGTVVTFYAVSGTVPTGATLKITEIGNGDNSADIAAGTQFTVKSGVKYAIQYAEAGHSVIPPAPENILQTLFPELAKSCEMTFELPEDTQYAAVVDESAVAYTVTTDDDLVIAAKNIGTVSYNDLTGVCTLTLPDDVPAEWDEVHFNYRFSNGVSTTGDGLVTVALVRDDEYKLQFKTGTTADKLLPAAQKDIDLNALKYEIISNESWTVAPRKEYDWLKLVTTRGYGNGTVFFTVESLTDSTVASRTAWLTITSSSGLALECSVTQMEWPADVTQSIVRTPQTTVTVLLDVPKDASFRIAADTTATAYMLDDGGNAVIHTENVGTVTVDSTTQACTYTLPATIDEDWDELHFSYAFTNGSLTTDQATVVLSLADPPYLQFKPGTVTPKSIPADTASLGELSFAVESNESWIVYLNDPCTWLTLKTTSGKNSGSIYFTVDSNLDRGVERSTSMVVYSASGKALVFTVYQMAGQEPVLTLNAESMNLPGTAAVIKLELEANVDWNAIVVGAPEWATLSASDGQGAGTVSLTLQENAGTAARSCVVSFESIDIFPTLYASCTVSQSGVMVADQPSLAAGWNLRALTCYPAEPTRWFPKGTLVYAMESNTPVTTLEPGKPYWLYAPTATDAQQNNAYPLHESWTQPVVTMGRWTAVGVAKSYTLEQDAVAWTWDASRQQFVLAESLEPGKAYWIYK